jgi:hypothetical protein
MYLVQTMDKVIRLERNLQFSVYRQTQTKAGAGSVLKPVSNESSHLETAEKDMNLQPQSDESATTEPVALDQYLESDQVMLPAAPLGFIDLIVTDAYAPSAPGAMTLKLWINGTGKVVHTEIEKSDFPSAYSDAIAAVFGSAVFAPAQVQGLPVNSILRIETRYE